MVGSSVVSHLVATGHEVRALSRSEASDRTLRRLGASPVRGDVLERRSLPRLMEGADVVFHIAGVNEMCVADPAPMVRANVEGSVNVVEAARDAGVSRVVHTSSAAALGEEPGTVGTEQSEHRGWFLSDYERSKHLAEKAVRSIPGVDVVTVNPSSVQGPGRTTGTGKIVLEIVRGRLPVVMDSVISIVDIDDCARGHLAAAFNGRSGARYVLNSFTITMREAVSLLEAALGRALPVRYLPSRVVSVMGAVGEITGRLTGREPPLCRQSARTLVHGHRYDGSLAASELGLRYARPDELLGRLIDWYRREGLIER